MGVEIHRMRSWNEHKIVALLWVDAGMQQLQDLKAVASCQLVFLLQCRGADVSGGVWLHSVSDPVAV